MWDKLLSIGGSLLGNWLGYQGQQQQAQAQNALNLQQLQLAQAAASQNQQNWFDTYSAARSDQSFNQSMALQQWDYQKRLNEEGIRMRVADARAAGLSPLAALGNTGQSISPIQVGGGSYPSPGSGVPSLNLTAPDSPLSKLSGMGQDISRAINATRDYEERKEVAQTAQQLERDDLQNQLLRLQVKKLSQDVSPPWPSEPDRYLIPGQSASGGKIEIKGDYVPTARNEEAQVMPATAKMRWPDGSYTDIPSKDAKDRLEDMGMPYTWSHWFLSQVMPTMGAKGWWNPPPDSALPPGHRWGHLPIRGYFPVSTRFNERFGKWR